MKILLADDDPIARAHLGGLLKKWGYDVTTARDGNESWRALEGEDAPQLAILDWKMPGPDGIELCRRLRLEKKARYVYAILLTSNDRKEDVISGIDAGADDYLTKPFEPQELQARLRAGRRVLDLEEALRFQATHDVLTHAWNRRGIFDLLAREVARADRERSALSVIAADVDFFKRVNDVHGHQAGDVVLVEVAARLRGSMRAYDGVGRNGGEEFIIVAPGLAADAAAEAGERMRQRIGSEPIAFPGGALRVTASFGVAARAPGAGVDALVKAADEALYRAKRRGRNRVELSGAEPAGERRIVRDPRKESFAWTGST